MSISRGLDKEDVVHIYRASQVALVVQNLPANAGDVRDMSSIPGSGRSPAGRHSNPLQYSRLKNPMDKRSLANYGPNSRKETEIAKMSMKLK